MEIIVHHKISDLYKTLNLHFENETDFTIMSIPDIHAQIPFKSPMLRADYFSFILTIDGSGIYYLDDNKFPFDSETIYFTNPGHIKSYELNESKDAYIITLTAHAMSGDKNKYLEMGMDDYLGKPVRLETLQKALNRYFSKKKNVS